jgi:5-methylcytosine-specific restriction endonuclease McrA
MINEWYDENDNPSEWEKKSDWDSSNEIEDLDNGVERPELPSDRSYDISPSLGIDDGTSKWAKRTSMTQYWKCPDCDKLNKPDYPICYYCYINSSHWEIVRKRKLKSIHPPNTCERCGVETRFLEVHHLTYVRLGEEKLDDLMVLCMDCHKGTVHTSPDNPRSDTI